MTPSTDVLESALPYRDGATQLLGWLASPRGSKEPRPGVLVVPEWWGLNEYAKCRARQLAREGYVALGVDMYGGGAVTSDQSVAATFARDLRTGDVARRRITCALDALRSRPEVDSNRIAVVGFCFGGSVAMELARSGADIRSATCFHGSLATPLPARLETLRASVLVLNGADDAFVSQNEVQAFEAEMRAAGADWQVLSLGGAVHSFSNPDADAANIPGVSFHSRSERRAWRLFKLFLRETLDVACDA
jgi:dienelactone hydrolase